MAKKRDEIKSLKNHQLSYVNTGIIEEMKVLKFSPCRGQICTMKKMLLFLLSQKSSIIPYE